MKTISLTLLAPVLAFLASGWAARAADDGLFSVLNIASTAKLAASPMQTAPSAPATSPAAQQVQPAQPVASAGPQDGLARVNAAIGLYPNNPSVYVVRGNIYSEKKQWDDARKDYEKALSLDPQNAAAKVNLAELEFRQKQYDQARTQFLAIKGDKNLGDLAAYMVFLCDLYAAHDAAASQELAVFNAAGENASYYFGNIAWDLFHRNMAGARDYLQSAQNIYPPHKINLYESNLIETGYLPLKD